MKVRLVPWWEFRALCGPGFAAMPWIAGFLMVVLFLTQGGAWAMSKFAAADRARDVEYAVHYNTALSLYERGRTPVSGLVWKDRRFIGFVLRYTAATSDVERNRAYLAFTREARMPEAARECISRANAPNLSAYQRVHQLFYWTDCIDVDAHDVDIHPSNPVVDATYAFLRNDHRRHRASIPPAHVYRAWTVQRWQVLTAYVIACLAMAFSYHLGEQDPEGRRRWALPANLGGWGVALFFLPVFVVPWLLAALYGLGCAVWRPLRWLLTEADLRDLPGRLAASRAADEVALRERVSDDVLRRQSELRLLRDEAVQLEDPAERQAALARILEAERLLALVKEARAKAWEENVAAASDDKGFDARLETFIDAVDGLAEGEKVSKPKPKP